MWCHDMVGADMVIVVVLAIADLIALGLFYFFSSPMHSFGLMTLLIADVFVCVGIGCVHPSYAKAGCVLTIFVSLNAPF